MAQIKESLDIKDEHLEKHVWACEGAVYSGDIMAIAEPPPKEKVISPLLASAVIGFDNTATPTYSTTTSDNIWTDIDAQEIYSNKRPTCYIILGKPGLDDYHLGEAISKKYHCIHLCPSHLINDEIKQNSLTGKCLDFNMRHNNICGYETVLKLLQQKIKSPAVQYRGYVISGLPIVTANEKPSHLIKSKHGEEAFSTADAILFDLICNLKKKSPGDRKETKPTSGNNLEELDEEAQEEEEEKVEEQQAEEEEEGVAELPKFYLDTCSHVFINCPAYYETKYATLLHQLNEVFDSPFKPDIVIHITCPDLDVITIKNHQYINYKNGHYVIKPFSTNVDTDLRWPGRYTLKDYENPHDLHVFNPKYNCKAPINFYNKSVTQLCNYKQYILPYIEGKIMDYDPRHVIKLDGRNSTHQMMHEFSERLLLMDVTPVIMPEPLYLTDVPEGLEEFWETARNFKVIRSGVITFNRYPSPWFNRCPVELKKRQSIVGKPKYAVMMFKHVYLMSSSDNFISFCMNPRPFLKLRYLEPTCRIVVMGSKSSGKSMIAKCLSWIFDVSVICYDTVLKIEREKKYNRYSLNILSEIGATIEDARLKEWQNKENIRLAKLNKWNVAIMADLKKYIPLFKKHLEASAERKKQRRLEKAKAKAQEGEQLEDLGENEAEEEGSEENFELDEEVDATSSMQLQKIKRKLFFLPCINDLNKCEEILKNQDASEYAEAELTTMIDKPLQPALGDEDVTKGISEYIIANDLTNEIEPTTEELMSAIIAAITSLDNTPRSETSCQEIYGKFVIDGLPSNPEFIQLLSDAKLTPDYTIAAIENRELDVELMKYYLSIEKIQKNYFAKLSLVNDPLVLSKLQTKKIPRDEISSESHEASNEDEITDEIAEKMITSFNESLEQFREDWNSVKLHLEDKYKCFIEIELQGKTDVEILEEVFLMIRKGYYLIGTPNEDDDGPEDEDNESTKDLLIYNNPKKMCETSIYCPYTYFNYGVLWEGKREFSLKYDNKIHYFAKEEFLEQFQKDVTKYQAYKNPFKKLPALKICVIGCVGSGKSLIAKRIAIEFGLIHIDFEDFINNYFMPRHFKKVGRKYENPFTDMPVGEEGVVEFQPDEENVNLLDEILSNEAELRRIVYSYYERGQPIMPLIMHKIIKQIWNTRPYNHTGFVLDGYPRLPQDVEDLIECNCIPDLVVQLESTPEDAIDRVGPIMFKQWQSQLKEAKEANKRIVQIEKKKWFQFITKTIVAKLIIHEIIEKMVVEPADEEVPEKNASGDSYLIAAGDSALGQMEQKFFELYNDLIQEFMEPTDTREWEKSEDVRENINARLEALYETDLDNIESLKEILFENKVNIFTFNSSKPFYKVIRIILSKLKFLRGRNQSFFEQTFIIPSDIAELLLSQGVCFLSKFNRLCPVYIYENPNTIMNSYKISRSVNKIFPIIHRVYVYFVSSEDNVHKFRSDPLKYISSSAINTYHSFPLSIGILGPPKSGKSTLAEKLAKNNYLVCISKGTALNNIIENMPWTELGSKILKQLNNGDTVDTDCIMRAVQTAAIDHRTVTYGFVLDGFPRSPYEAKFLVQYHLYPNIMFDLTSDKEVILDNSQKEIYYDILKYMPPYSRPFIECRFQYWSEQSPRIRAWVHSDHQNIFKINGNESKWQCLQTANNYLKDRMSQIHFYLANVKTSIVPAYAMNICNETFRKYESQFQNLCPVCLRKNVLRHNGYPDVDKAGVVHYRNELYWVCSEHMDLVLTKPYYYLTNYTNIPELPAVVHVINTNNVYANGICIVTYAENLPGQLLERGSNKYAVAYKHKTYLFCSEICRRKFLDKPHIYADITVFKGAEWFPKLSLKKLPDLGYLEQTLANILTEACCAVNAIRPKYPGLSGQLSGVIYIALYLKTHNPRLPRDQFVPFKNALKLFEDRSRLILDLGLRMRSMENPFNDYPKCHHGTPKYYSPRVSETGALLPGFEIEIANAVSKEV